MNISFIITTLLLNIIFVLIFNKVSKKFNLYDYPSSSRKIHKNKVSLTGGFLFYSFYFIYFIFYLINSIENFFTFKEAISLMLFSSLFFFIGLYDDRFDLKPNTKLYLMLLISLCLITFNNDFVIKELNFSFISKSLFLGNFSILFTIICFVCFVNACNMFDGIDLQFGIYLVFLCIIFISKGIIVNLFFGLIICSIFFLFNNYRKKIFIGNNGTLFLGFLFSFLFIGFYNKGNNFFADEIFLIMAIPGFDLIRVSILRLLKGKHMFQPDNLHIHHLLIKKNSLIKTNLITQSAIIFPILTFYYFQNFFISLLLSIIVYVSIIFYTKNIN